MYWGAPPTLMRALTDPVSQTGLPSEAGPGRASNFRRLRLRRRRRFSPGAAPQAGLAHYCCAASGGPTS